MQSVRRGNICNRLPGDAFVLGVKIRRQRPSASSRLHGRFAAFCFGVVAGFRNKFPSKEEFELFRKVYIEFGLDCEPVHDEPVRCVEKPASVTDRKTRRVLNEAAEGDLFFEEFLPIVTKNGFTGGEATKKNGRDEYRG